MQLFCHCSMGVIATKLILGGDSGLHEGCALTTSLLQDLQGDRYTQKRGRD